METTKTQTAQSIYPALRYQDPRAAIAWLTSVLGFQEHEVITADDGSIVHAELSRNGNLIMLGSTKNDPFGKSPRELGGVSGSIYIALETPADIDTLYAQVKRSKAEIIRELTDTDYGSHDFGVRDPQGQVWSFGTYRPQAT